MSQNQNMTVEQALSADLSINDHTGLKESKIDYSNSTSTITSDPIIHWINSRRSIGNLTIPAPTDEQVIKAIECAVTAPDHKKLRPWRFIVVKGNARHELGRAFLAAAEAQATQKGEVLDDKARQKAYNMPLRAPMIITVVTQIKPHDKVPAFEQLLSTGAAVQNLILALKAQGFSSVWRTGPLCNEPAVKAYFEVDEADYVAAFVYTGSSHCEMPSRGEIEIEDVLSFK